MSEESKERRINLEDLPQAGQVLTPEEFKDVQGSGTAKTGGLAKVGPGTLLLANTNTYGGHSQSTAGQRLAFNDDISSSNPD